MALWSFALGEGEGPGGMGGGGEGGWEAESQLFVLNGKNVLVNVYQNVNYLYDYSLHVDLTIQNIIGINVLFLYKVQTFRPKV